MELTCSLVDTMAREYLQYEPLATVEQEQIESLPRAFRRDDFGWRDTEWILRWYYRRFLGEYPHSDRQRIESAYRSNDFETVRSTILDCLDLTSTTDRINRLTSLHGVSLVEASAFLMFLGPESYIVIGDREWTILLDCGELDEPYPSNPNGDDYIKYLDKCRSIGTRCDCNLWTVYRALWRLWSSTFST